MKSIPGVADKGIEEPAVSSPSTASSRKSRAVELKKPVVHVTAKATANVSLPFQRAASPATAPQPDLQSFLREKRLQAAQKTVMPI